MPNNVTGCNWRVVLQKEPRSKQIVVKIVDPMIVAMLGDSDMETIEQLQASINVV
jgi:hypothetical protein